MPRMAAQSVKIEAGRVHLPTDAPWLADLLSEVCGFPNTAHDDQVDALSQALYWGSLRRIEPPLTVSLPYYGR